MRKISAWVAIAAVATGVTGFLGQNVAFPGFGTRAAYLTSVTVIITFALTLYTLFRHKKWL